MQKTEQPKLEEIISQYNERIKKLENELEKTNKLLNNAWSENHKLGRRLEAICEALHPIIAAFLGVEEYKTTLKPIDTGFTFNFEKGYIKGIKGNYGVNLTINIKRTNNEFLNDLIYHELQSTIDSTWIKQMKERGYTTDRRKVFLREDTIEIQTSPKELIGDWEQTQAALKMAFNRYRLIVEGNPQ